MRSADRAFLVFLAALLAPLIAFAGTRPLTLSDCVGIALGRSPDLHATEFDIRSASENITAVQAGLFPSLSAQASALNLYGQPTNAFSLLNTFDPLENPQLSQPSQSSASTTTTTTETTTAKGGTKDTTSATTTTKSTTASAASQNNTQNSQTKTTKGIVGFGSVTLTYNLFKDGSILGLNDAPTVGVAKAQRAVLTWTKDLKREQIIFVVATSFLDAATRAERVRLDTRRVELCVQRLANIEMQAKLGLKLPTDVGFAKVQLTSSQQMLRLSNAQNTSARLHLAALIGMKPDRLVVSTRLPDAPALPPMDKILANAFVKHPGVGVQGAIIDQQFNTYRLARAQTYPQVALTSSYIYGADFAAPADRHLYTSSLVVSIPIFDFGMLQASKRAAQDKYEAEKIRLEKVTDDIRNSILDTYGALIVIQETAALYERNTAQADTAFQVSRSQSEAGLVPPLAAIDAELVLIDQKEALNDERELELQQFANLQNAAGGSWTWIR